MYYFFCDNLDISLAELRAAVAACAGRSLLGAALSQLGTSPPSVVARRPYHSAYFQARADT